MAMIETTAIRAASVSFLASVFKMTYPLLACCIPVYEKKSEQLPAMKSTDGALFLTNSMNKLNLSSPFLPDKVWKNLRQVFQFLKAPQQTLERLQFSQFGACLKADSA